MSNWNAEQVLRAYGRHMMPKVGKIGPKGHENETPGPDINLTAWLYVVTSQDYDQSEHWLRAKYVFQRDDLSEEAQSVISDFKFVLEEKLEICPFNPASLDREDPRGNVRLAKVSIRDAAFMARVSVRTVQDWCKPESGLTYEWRGKRLFVQVGGILDIIQAREDRRYWMRKPSRPLHSTKVAS